MKPVRIDGDVIGYRVVGHPGAETMVELHVLARAYRDAWTACTGRAPIGFHWFSRLELAIEFLPPEKAA